jgi:hypothetical protein
MFFSVVTVLVATASPARAFLPSQVLVVYNESWSEFSSERGQDSKRVADHYVRMHTDPQSGEKPYMLGLECPSLRPGMLKEWRMVERSADNGSGVVIRQAGSDALRDAGGLRDGRLVELVLPEDGAPWDMRTLGLELEADSFPSRLALVKDGLSLHPDKVVVKSENGWHVRALGSAFVRGGFRAHARCMDAAGKIREWTAAYADFRDVVATATGSDGVRDDQNYLDCIEKPIKAFLEDSANARPDGTLLKDHILFFVICYGLPRTVSAPCGVATGITAHLRDFGSEIALGQRLQIMYIDLETAADNKVGSMKFEPGKGSEGSGFTDYLFRSGLAKPIIGQGLNPFLHPDVYRKKKAGALAATRRFTPENRKADPRRHLYFSMRIDGPDALSAMELVDRAVYASTFAGPVMGVLAGHEPAESPDRTGSLGQGSPGRFVWDRGYKHLYQHPRGWTRLEFLRLAPDSGFFNRGDVFLPGGIATFVQSSQGWNKEGSRFMSFLEQGVTVTAGAARVAPGHAPHIHNRSFWDEDLLYPYLLDGYSIGEILLMSQIHLGWITSFVGDPAYRLPGRPLAPPPFPAFSWDGCVRVRRGLDKTHGKGVVVMADLGTSAVEPRVAQMRLVREDDPDGHEYLFARFSSRPHVFVPDVDVHIQGVWRLELIDPFGRRAELRGRLLPPADE